MLLLLNTRLTGLVEFEPRVKIAIETLIRVDLLLNLGEAKDAPLGIGLARQWLCLVNHILVVQLLLAVFF